MHRCFIIAVGTDDFPTVNLSCYSYSQCRKLCYSVGVGWGFFESVNSVFSCISTMCILGYKSLWNFSRSGNLPVYNLKFSCQFCLVPSYHLPHSDFLCSILSGCFFLSFFPCFEEVGSNILSDKNGSCQLNYFTCLSTNRCFCILSGIYISFQLKSLYISINTWPAL